MTTERKTEWVVERSFDAKNARHYINGLPSVLHCHHYATLYCQLADDAEQMNGKALLRKSAELTFYKVLSDYYAKHNVTCIHERLSLAAEYWQFCGMGRLTFPRVGAVSGRVEMPRSHVDEGWIKKWGKRDTPVNFIGQGYLAAALAAAYELPTGSFSVNEIQSIVSGAATSVFSYVRN